MNQKFKIGDFVEVLDQEIEGKIVKIESQTCYILTPDGFEIPFLMKEVILKQNYQNIFITAQDIALSKSYKDKLIKVKKIEDFTKTKTQYKQQEVDLHIDKLIKNHKHLSNFEILNHQLKIAKIHLDQAIINKVQKIIFIHGIGTGVLRSELEYLFQKYENTNFQDADYGKYGNGAVEIYFKQIAFK